MAYTPHNPTKDPTKSTGRFIRPEDTESSPTHDTRMLQKQILEASGIQDPLKVEGWRVYFAGNIEAVEAIANNHAYITAIDTTYNLNGEGLDIGEVVRGICDRNGQYDAVVFCAQPEDVIAFRKKRLTFENRFYPPVILVSETPLEQRFLNVYHIDTKGKDPVLLKQELTRIILEGKKFVEYVKNAALLIMAKNPEEYADLKQRNLDNVYIVPATEEGYEEAKAYLESRDVIIGDKTIHGKKVVIGGVAVDDTNELQIRLLIRLDNESLCKGIPFAYIGRAHSVYTGQFERCKTIPGEEIKQKGLMRLLEDFDPSKKETTSKATVQFSRHDTTYTEGGARSITARFDEPESIDPNAETQLVQRPKIRGSSDEDERARFRRQLEKWDYERREDRLGPEDIKILIELGIINSEDELVEEEDLAAKMDRIEAENAAKGIAHQTGQDSNWLDKIAGKQAKVGGNNKPK